LLIDIRPRGGGHRQRHDNHGGEKTMRVHDAADFYAATRRAFVAGLTRYHDPADRS